MTITPVRITGWEWDEEYLREHCTLDHNSIMQELAEQARLFNYSIGWDDIEQDAARILAEWEDAYDIPDADAISIPGFGRELI